MAKLTTKKRKALPKTDFAIPSQKKYPLPDAAHARDAISRAAAQGPAVEKKVRAAVAKKFPSIKQAKPKGK